MNEQDPPEDLLAGQQLGAEVIEKLRPALTAAKNPMLFLTGFLSFVVGYLLAAAGARPTAELLEVMKRNAAQVANKTKH